MSPTTSLYTAVLGGKYLFYSSFTLVLWDHLITIDQEVTYFWREKWSITSVLYMVSRYLADAEVLLIAAIYAGPSFEACQGLQIAVYIVAALEILVNQGVICLRVWYLFTHNVITRTIVAIVYIICMATILTLLFKTLGLQPADGNPDSCGTMSHITDFWPVYLTAVLLHSVLYVLTIIRSLGNSWGGRGGILKRFLQEGGPMYFMATGALIYSFVATKLTNAPEAYVPAIESYFASSMVAIAVCHAILSLRTLAARLDVDPTWLLSHSEMSRLQWKRGPDGEIIVDCDVDKPGALELRDVPTSSKTRQSVNLTINNVTTPLP